MNKPIYLYVTPFFPSPTSWRGAYCLDFVKALVRTGRYDVYVFMEGEGADYDFQDVRVHRFPVCRLPSNILPFLFDRYNVRSFLNHVAACGISLEDVAVCHANTANYGIYPLAIKSANPKCITLLHHHDLQSFGLSNGILCHCWPYNVLQYPLLRRMHERIDCHVFISEQARRSFLVVPDTSWTEYGYYKKQMRGLGFYRSPRIRHSIVLHNGVDTTLFTSDAKVAREGPFTIGCVGNFSVLKDQMGLLRAMKMVSEKVGESVSGGVVKCGSEDCVEKIKVVFVGSGSELAKCETYAKANVVDVEFRSEVRHEQLPDFYRSLDLFVLPSWFEGFGCVFTEAWACGVPFITCEGQGVCDLIPAEERNLWLCRQRDPMDLADKIIRYFKERPKQHLSGAVSIDELVSRFVRDIDRLSQTVVENC